MVISNYNCFSYFWRSNRFESRVSCSSLYICNILKCRPPKNLDPLPEEVMECEPFLKKQLSIVWDCGNGSAGPAVEALCKRLRGKHKILFSPVFNKLDLKTLAEWVLEDNSNYDYNITPRDDNEYKK